MASQNIEDEVYSAMEMFASLADEQLDQYFTERIGDAEVLATTSDVYQSLNEDTRKATGNSVERLLCALV